MEPSELDITNEEVSLTQRQAEVVRLAATEHSNKEIANTLGISESAVKQHLGRAMLKLRIRSRFEIRWRLTNVRLVIATCGSGPTPSS